MNYFPSNIKYLREKYNMSQNQLAKRLQVNHSTISRWESGDMGATVANAYDLAEIFNIPIAYLVGSDLRNSVIHNTKTITLSKDIGKYKKGEIVDLNEMLDYMDNIYTKNKSYEDMFKELSDKFGNKE